MKAINVLLSIAVSLLIFALVFEGGLRLNRRAVGFRAAEQDDLGKAASQRNHHLGMAKTAKGGRFQRQNVCRQAAAKPGGERDDLSPPVCVMNHEARRAAARLAPGLTGGADLGEDVVCGRRFIADRARRTGRRAGAAAGADHRVDGDMLARWRNGAGGAEIKAAATSLLLSPGMGAKRLFQADMQRLFEDADHARRLQTRFGDGARVAGIGAQIAVAFLVRRKGRRAAAQIEDEVAFGRRAITRRGETQRAASGGNGRAEAVKRDREPAKRPGGRTQPADMTVR